MKIISKFIDYYDYVGDTNQYDHQVIYDRKDFNSDDLNFSGTTIHYLTDYGIINFKEIIKNIQIAQNFDHYIEYNNSLYTRYALKYLIVMDKVYLLVSQNKDKDINKVSDYNDKFTNFKIVNEKDHPELIDLIIKKFNKKHFSWYDKISTNPEYTHLNDWNDGITIGAYDPNLVKLSKLLNKPVFCIIPQYHSVYNTNKVRQLKVELKVPNLKEVGYTMIEPNPVKLYSELEFFIANELRDNPDIIPPVQINNSHKIEQHGFDLKKSFRHRK